MNERVTQSVNLPDTLEELSCIKKIPTNKLVEELISRDGFKVVNVGLFTNYELKPKYGADIIEADKIILIPSGMILNA